MVLLLLRNWIIKHGKGFEASPTSSEHWEEKKQHIKWTVKAKYTSVHTVFKLNVWKTPVLLKSNSSFIYVLLETSHRQTESFTSACNLIYLWKVSWAARC